jgi:hypothetical protein
MHVAYLRDTVRKTKSDAKCRRNLEFTIDLDYLVKLLAAQDGKCALSGWTLEFTRGGDFKGGKNPRGCTVDRIDNAMGYVPGNVQLACCLPNYLKADMEITEFRALCRDIGSIS